jgi:hypothetical protein
MPARPFHAGPHLCPYGAAVEPGCRICPKCRRRARWARRKRQSSRNARRRNARRRHARERSRPPSRGGEAW